MAQRRYGQREKLQQAYSAKFTQGLETPSTLTARGDVNRLQGDIFEYGFMYHFLTKFEKHLAENNLMPRGGSENAAHFKKLLEKAYSQSATLISDMAQGTFHPDKPQDEQHRKKAGIQDFFDKILNLAEQSADAIIAKYKWSKIKDIQINPTTDSAGMAIGDIFLFLEGQTGKTKEVILELKMYASQQDVGWVSSSDAVLFAAHAKKNSDFLNTVWSKAGVAKGPFWQYARANHWNLRGSHGRKGSAEWRAHILSSARQSFFGQLYPAEGIAKSPPEFFKIYYDLLHKGSHKITTPKDLVMGHVKRTASGGVYNTITLNQELFADAMSKGRPKIAVRHNVAETKFLIEGKAAMIAALVPDTHKVKDPNGAEINEVHLKRQVHTTKAKLSISQAYINYAAQKVFNQLST